MIFRGFYHPIPDRIRINGLQPRKLLQKILDIKIGSSSSPVVILKPFKLLEFYEDVIRGLYERLSESFNKSLVVYREPITPETAEAAETTKVINDFKAVKAADDVRFLEAANLAEITQAVEDEMVAEIYETTSVTDAIDAINDPEFFKAVETVGKIEASEIAEIAAGPKRPNRADIFENETYESLLQVYGTRQAFKELNCLIDFMDHDLKVLKHFKDRSMNRVYFSDLWFVFRPGGEVISQRPLNAYRVLHVGGGRPYLSPPKEGKGNDTASQALEKSSDFRITCYQVGFDGVKFRPIFKYFTFQDTKVFETSMLSPSIHYNLMTIGKAPGLLCSKMGETS